MNDINCWSQNSDICSGIDDIYCCTALIYEAQRRPRQAGVSSVYMLHNIWHNIILSYFLRIHAKDDVRVRTVQSVEFSSVFEFEL